MLLTKDKMEIFKSRFFKWFSRIWRNRDKYKVERIEERADPYPTSTLTLNWEEEKLFQKYLVFLSIR